MKPIKMALAVVCAFASTAATAGVVDKTSQSGAAAVSTCYYQYTIITAEADYHVYECYSNGDGSY